MWAPAPFQSPLIGFGSRSTRRRRSPRRCGRAASGPSTCWSPTSSGPTGPIWNSHWPSITSALVPEMCEAGLDAGRGVGLDDVAARRSRRRRRRSSTGPAGRGSRRWGQPSGRPSLRNVYSCSMPNTAPGRRTSRPTAAQRGPGVGRVRRHVGEQHLAHHEDVVAAADRVRARRTPAAARSRSLSPGAWLVSNRRSPRCRARRRRR